MSDQIEWLKLRENSLPSIVWGGTPHQPYSIVSRVEIKLSTGGSSGTNLNNARTYTYFVEVTGSPACSIRYSCLIAIKGYDFRQFYITHPSSVAIHVAPADLFILIYVYCIYICRMFCWWWWWWLLRLCGCYFHRCGRACVCVQRSQTIIIIITTTIALLYPLVSHLNCELATQQRHTINNFQCGT